MHLTNQNLPPWVVLHLPHCSTEIPASVRDQFLISDEELAHELEILTDHHVEALFIDPERPEEWAVLRGAVSRLVVDLERFVDDEREPAARHGFGAIYTRTTTGKALRRDLSSQERASLLSRHELHNRLLALWVKSRLDNLGRCLVLDCHTFPDQVLPFEVDGEDQERPDICIGSDPHHTPPALVRAFVAAFEEQGWSVAVNRPFAGSIVPQHAYAKNVDVETIMVDVNRRICVDESGPVDGPDHAIAKRVQASCRKAIATYLEEEEAASEPKNLLEEMAERLEKEWRDDGYTVRDLEPSDTGRLTVNFIPHRRATEPVKTSLDSSEESERKADDSANTSKPKETQGTTPRRPKHSASKTMLEPRPKANTETPTTGAKTPKVRGSWRELPPDDPIYNRGFAIGVTRSRNYSADTTKQGSESLPEDDSHNQDEAVFKVRPAQSEEASKRQAELPPLIHLVRHYPVRRSFSLKSFDPVGVCEAGDLPPYLMLGSLDESSFELSSEGWSAIYRGCEEGTHLRLKFKHAGGFYSINEKWCGVDGAIAQAHAPSLSLFNFVGRVLYPTFPEKWDRAAKENLERDFQINYVETPPQCPISVGVPDGVFRTIAIPLGVQDLRRALGWLRGLAESGRPTYPFSAEAKPFFQTVNYAKAEDPAWARSAEEVWHRSVLDLQLVPEGLPTLETASDGSSAWELRRSVYVLLITVPFAGVTNLITEMAAPDGLIRTADDSPISLGLRPLVLPSCFELQAKWVEVWDQEQKNHSRLLFSDARQRKVTVAAPFITQKRDELEWLLSTAEDISEKVIDGVAWCRRLRGSA